MQRIVITTVTARSCLAFSLLPCDTLSPVSDLSPSVVTPLVTPRDVALGLATMGNPQLSVTWGSVGTSGFNENVRGSYLMFGTLIVGYIEIKIHNLHGLTVESTVNRQRRSITGTENESIREIIIRPSACLPMYVAVKKTEGKPENTQLICMQCMQPSCVTTGWSVPRYFRFEDTERNCRLDVHPGIVSSKKKRDLRRR